MRKNQQTKKNMQVGKELIVSWLGIFPLMF